MFDKLAEEKVLERTAVALRENNLEVITAENGKDAKAQVMKLIPDGAEVMTMTSVTLDTLGISEEINNSGRLISVKNKLFSMKRETQNLEMQKLGAAPEYAVGSVHAVTEDGKVIVVAASGSNIPAYAYGSAHVIWVVGTQKIVKDVAEGMKRIYEYVLPLESERARKAYGVAGSAVNKIFILNKEMVKGRVTLIFVNEKLGF